MTIKEQVTCARRELAIRTKVYPGWVKRKRMTYQEADHEIRTMEAVVSTLEQVEKIDGFLRSPELLPTQDMELADLVCELVGLEKGRND